MTKQEPGARHTQDEGRGHPPPGGRQGRKDNPPENTRELLPDPGLHDVASGLTTITWPSRVIEAGEPHNIDPRYYLDRGYIAYRGAWYLPWELPWWVRWLIRRLRKSGVQAVFLDPNAFGTPDSKNLQKNPLSP